MNRTLKRGLLVRELLLLSSRGQAVRAPRSGSWIQCVLKKGWRLSMNRRICRQVLECGDGVREVTALAVAALEIREARRRHSYPDPKRRLRRLRRRNPRRSRANSRRTRFMVPMGDHKMVEASHEETLAAAEFLTTVRRRGAPVSAGP